MKKYYAVGNFGSGSQLMAFISKSSRDDFVAWGKADNRRAYSRQDAIKAGYKHATNDRGEQISL